MNAHSIESGKLLALAREVTAPWSEILAVWEEFQVRYGLLLRADVGDVEPQNFLVQAFGLAAGLGHLPALLVRLAEKGLVGESFQAAADALIERRFQLQAYVNDGYRPQHALQAGRRLFEACDHVCRISVDGEHKGTGILVRPNVVATAGHVIDGLVDGGLARSDSLRRLELHFFDADDVVSGSTGTPLTAKLHEDWLIHYSPPAPHERLGAGDIDTLTGITPQSGPWDLALIRLAEPPRKGLAGYAIRDRAAPEPIFGVHVLHHPADPVGQASPLLWSIGDVKQALGQPAPLRWLHSANTDHGSSGAPCFNMEWDIVALHQAGPHNMRAPNQTNRAVPVYPWARQIDALAGSGDSTPYLAHVETSPGDQAPLLGRRDLQASLWSAMAADVSGRARRLFIVRGASRTGKSFTWNILRTLAAQAGSRAIYVDAANAQADDAAGFAQRLVGAAGAQFDDLPSQALLTTPLRDVRNEILPATMAEFNRLAAGRPLWLFIDSLDQSSLPAESNTLQLLEGMIAAMGRAPGLRLVLAGWKGPLVEAQVEDLDPAPSVKHIVDYLWLALAPPGLALGAQIEDLLTRMVLNKLAGRDLETGGYEAALEAAAALRETVAVITAAFQPEPAHDR